MADAKTPNIPPEATDSAAPAQPLFYKNPIPVDPVRHGHAGLSIVPDYSFASATNSVMLNLVEFMEAARHYPIVFTGGEPCMPAVVLGLEKNNYFVDGKGQWKENTYIPAYVRRYPFGLMHVPQQNQYVLCVDEDAGQFSSPATKGAVPFFDSEGKPSDTVRGMMEFAMAFQAQHAITQAFCHDLREAGVLASCTSNFATGDGRTVSLSGFFMIDEQKFNALPDEKFLEFRRKGWLPFVYFALMASSNWKKIGDIAALKKPKSRPSGALH